MIRLNEFICMPDEELEIKGHYTLKIIENYNIYFDS